LGPSEINGLPAHVLLVHAVVVLVPLAALLLVLVAVWPAARRRVALTAAVVAVVALLAVPLTTQAGEWLQRRVPPTPLVSQHVELGDGLLPWMLGLAVLAILIWGRPVLARRRSTTSSAPPGPADGPGAATRPSSLSTGHRAPSTDGSSPLPGGTAATVVLAVLAIVIAVGAVADVYAIGESGSRAAWTNHFSSQPLPGTTRGRG
jgi:hypothetical protein